jgi:chromosomal replication initiator protein
MNYIAVPGMKSRMALNAIVSYHPDKVNEIIQLVENCLRVPYDKLKHRTRKREVCFARQVCMYLLSTRTHASLKTIGDLFNRDHSSVIHARELIKDLMETDENVKMQVANLIAKL